MISLDEVTKLYNEGRPNEVSALRGVSLDIARDAVYFLEVPPLTTVLSAFVWSGAVFCIGWVYFRRRSMEISEEP